MVWLVYHLTVAVKSQDVIPYAARTPRFHLMFMPEEFHSGKASSVVKLSMSENTQKGAFPSVYITHYRNPAKYGKNSATIIIHVHFILVITFYTRQFFLVQGKSVSADLDYQHS